MDEGKTPIIRTETPASGIEKKDSVKQEWFDAYYQGNSLIPQANEGIVLCLAIATILEDPDMDWQRFTYSQFSHSQTDFLYHRAIAQHRFRGVKGGEIVEKGRVESLWTAYRRTTLNALVDYISGSSNSDVDINGMDREDALEKMGYTVGEFFYNPANETRINDLKKALAVIRTSLKKPEVVKLLTKYKDEFRDPSKRKEGGNIWTNGYRSDFIGILESDIREAFHGSQPENMQYLLNV